MNPSETGSTDLRGLWRGLATAGLCLFVWSSLACGNSAVDGVPPPPFDDSEARFFYPTGLQALPDSGHLVVASSNFDRAFNSGTLIQLDLDVFDQAASREDGRLSTIPGKNIAAVARMDSFSGSLVLNSKKDALMVATRDRDLLIKAPLRDGLLNCPDDDCSKGALSLGSMDMDDPFDLRLGEAVLPGGDGPEAVFFVSHLAPKGLSDEEQEAYVAVIPERSLGAEDPFSEGAIRIPVGSYGSNSLAWSGSRGRLFVGGCFLRVPGETVVSCRLDFDREVASQNILRSLSVSAGTRAGIERSQLGGLTGGRGETVALAMSSDERFLYVATRLPNALLVIEPPAPGENEPVLHSVVPLPHSPGRIHVLEGSEGDRLALTSFDNDSLLIIDPTEAQVQAQVLPVGDGPWDISSVPTADGHRLFVSLFYECAVAAVDLPADRPFEAALVATVGACP